MGMNWLLKPTTNFPSRMMQRASEHFSPPNEVGNPLRGFMSGAAEGAGNVMDDMTSPFSMATALLGAPWLKGLGRGVQSLGRLDELRGINPSQLPMDMIPQGAESIFNAARSGRLAEQATNLDDIAEAGSRAAQKIRMPIGGNIDVADMMQKLNAFRGK
jgi:hypothetical protein